MLAEIVGAHDDNAVDLAAAQDAEVVEDGPAQQIIGYAEQDGAQEEQHVMPVHMALGQQQQVGVDAVEGQEDQVDGHQEEHGEILIPHLVRDGRR